MAENKFPSRQELLEALKKLQEASEKNEKLTRDLAKGKDLAPQIRKDVENCVNEQAKLVDFFINLSLDEPAKTRYYQLVQELEGLIDQLDKAQKMEQLEELKTKIGKTIQTWVVALEEIVAGVFKQAKD